MNERDVHVQITGARSARGKPVKLILLLIAVVVAVYILFFRPTATPPSPKSVDTPTAAASVTPGNAYGLKAPLDRTRAVVDQAKQRASDEP
jgi:hypothetical protein